ncbi:DNRLRE domain-containing protein [Actinosynnema pretiosum subsp. pretiosum]|uniref:DNRLRE domain-containing protein n=1 Tax=Actinosynnema pretiosum subsp. pretiosum TaxID=103721 RepID=A0AA45L7X5_9PSEU|nr:DNRLRE domain-containing protein [Actinosynnema pretiosum subsp. pretiosum]
MITGRALKRARSLAAGVALAVLATVAPAPPTTTAAAQAQHGLPDATTVGASPGALPPVEQTTAEHPDTPAERPTHPDAPPEPGGGTPATATVATTIAATAATHVHAPYLADYSTDQTFSVGTYNAGTNRATGFLRFDTLGPTLAGHQVLTATLWLFTTWSYSCAPRPVHVDEVTAPWAAQGLKSWPGPAHAPELATATFSSGYNAACQEDGAWQQIPLNTPALALIQRWADGAPNHGLAIRTANDDSYSWKKFATPNTPTPPRLEVTTRPTPTPQPPPEPDAAKHPGTPTPPRAPASTAATTQVPEPHVDATNPLPHNTFPTPTLPLRTPRTSTVGAQGQAPSPAPTPQAATGTPQPPPPPLGRGPPHTPPPTQTLIDRHPR